MLTAIAKLEFELRDVCHKKQPEPVRQLYPRWMDEDSDTLSAIEKDDSKDIINQLARNVDILIKRVSSLELKDQMFAQKSCTTSVCKESDSNISELLKFEAVKNTKNILIPSVRSTPALAAAVAAASANPPVFALDSDEEGQEVEIVEDETVEVVEEESVNEEVVVEEEAIVEEEEEEENVNEEVIVEEEVVVEEEDQETSPELTEIKVKGKLYYKDTENNIYAETEDGYEQIGIYNSKTKDIELSTQEGEEGEEGEEEEAIEVEEFIYKGKTYQRDTENNVYLEGDHIGTWNGKKIILLE
jgi:hypothetical protein